MTRSQQSELARRINGAWTLLRKRTAESKVVQALMRRYGVSHRQAYRYVQQAHNAGEHVAVPERKVVFTVKLPLTLVTRFRRLARSTGESLSALVTQALEAFLAGRGRG